MLRSYFKIAVRHLQRHKFITVINVAGLTVGMACCMLIVLYVRDELSFDIFHHHPENIYRVTTEITRSSTGTTDYDATTQFPLAPNLKKDISSIREAVRINAPGSLLVTVGDKKIWDESAGYADAGFFQVFNYPLIEGSAATVLKEPYSIVLTQSAARKYFGNESPLGKPMKVANFVCTVTGVAKDMPANTDLKMEMVMSFATLVAESNKVGDDIEHQWFMFSNTVTYVQLADHTDPARLAPELKNFVNHYLSGLLAKKGIEFSLHLQPLKNVHLHPRGDMGTVDETPLIWLYIVIAAFLVLIACINFMNLTTARAHERAREVGLRKALGAERKSLIYQFLTESLLITAISFLLALLAAAMLMPTFNSVTGKSLSLFNAADSVVYIALVLLVLVVGLIAGSYPALYLSGLIPVKVLKGNFIATGSRILIRRSLVVAQFAIAVALIIATVVVYSQLRFWQKKNLGFDKEQLVNVYLSDTDLPKAELLKSSFLRLSGIQGASRHNILMGSGVFNNNPVVHEGGNDKEAFLAGIIQSDFDLLKTTGIKLVAGRDFNPAMATDSADAFIINMAAARRLGFKGDVVGKRIEWRPGYTSRHGTIVGVVEDFNFRNLRTPVDPIIYMVKPTEAPIITLRLAPGDQQAVLKHVDEVWSSMVPDEPLNYTFVEKDIQAQYTSERVLGKLFGIFSGLAIFIACMGLLGLSMLISRQRTKEIGIRKVLGASVANISLLLSKDFLTLVLIGICIASPIAWYGMEKWLQHFAFRIYLEWWVFASTAITVVLIALCTVSLQSVSAALMNPVKSLRSE
ncbi:FtsX-like permease family protein [Chitinophaga polysaccharea]|uniref:ABC transporter permease n=1 Tax=Chitinophaga TaxID=79328 RepID=UPI00145517BE|nr:MULTISPECIES: ABC transporter permease [Chitinophaga]NLR60060.1 FtsX-like permease family protein [Chitinophaga polysaccharea]NLU94289.1 FtsX-like permease family protein [Chitinophaga sp. Ak27]